MIPPNGSVVPDLLRGLVPHPVDPPGEGQQDEEEEHEVPLPLQQVGAYCGVCGRFINSVVVSTPDGLRLLQLLLIEDQLRLVCNSCARRISRRNNGRQ